jgi:hypothetical protein
LICSFSSRWTILKKAGPIGRLFAERPWLFIANGKGEIGLPVNRLTVEQTDFQSARRRQMKKEKGFRRYGWIPIIGLWQARRDSNPQHPDLESGALPIRATGLYPDREAFLYNRKWKKSAKKSSGEGVV